VLQLPDAAEHTARTALAGNFFTVDLATVKGAFERLPWVRHADVRRRWPDAIELSLEEHEAVARWTPKDGEMRLVNSHGEVFLAGGVTGLPGFAGPEGSAPRVLTRFAEFNGSLAPISRRLVSIQLSSREAWRLRLDDGVLLDLGRDQPKHPLAERLIRFTETYPAARERMQAAIGVVDMRYPNGFALKTSFSAGNVEMSRSL
jgi:cell division protein FtsQ